MSRHLRNFAVVLPLSSWIVAKVRDDLDPDLEIAHRLGGC